VFSFFAAVNTMNNADEHRAAVELAYARLREKLEAKDVSVEGLKIAALEALAHARDEVELEDSSAPVGHARGAVREEAKEVK
jgi:hypothetical protein